MPMYIDTLDKVLSFLLAYEHEDVIWSWKVLRGYLEVLALIHEFCIFIDLYGLWAY